MTDPESAEIDRRLTSIRRDLAEVGRDDVRVVAVTKGFGPRVIERARAVGLDDIGESYAQELLSKTDALRGAVVHFIGRLQRNKVRKVADIVDLWHSVDRIEILEEIGTHAPAARVLIQVNAAGDTSKAGVDSRELPVLLDRAKSVGVDVVGLMTIGVLGDRNATRHAFADLDRLADEYGLPERSMGMSGDYLDAAAAGATILRLGTALFGDRP